MKLRFAAVALAAATMVLLGGCNSSEAAKAAATGNAGTAAPAAKLITVPEDQMAHVQVAPAARMNWTRQLRLTGSVDYNQFATTPVVSQISGPVARVLAVPGEHVTQGQALLEVSSPDVVQARNTFFKDRDALNLAQQVYRRDQDLYEHHAIAQAEVEQAESAQTQAQADLNAATQSLRILGEPDPAAGAAASAAPPTIPVKAPIAGTVVERDVAPGQLVQGGATQCFVISDMSTVWVLANVYQSDLGYVHVGDPVAIQTDAYPQTFHGRIQFIGTALDPNTRTLQARIETSNPRGELKKAMYVTAVIQAGTSRGVIAVPDAAVLRDDQNVPFVYVRAGQKNQFARRTVSIGDSENGFTEITAGLQPGEPVVGNGGLFLQFAASFQ
ncbi:MAG TPA: efflux RND transporter periplasmic adaptor subunit [Terriglobales bacterium]|jgi:cobalt-zinc-cadmium efflux system membrane fusion protein